MATKVWTNVLMVKGDLCLVLGYLRILTDDR
jgi:hypothetical protein